MPFENERQLCAREVNNIQARPHLAGSEIYNLALCGRRAQAVAMALPRYFGIPPQNLATQGYGMLCGKTCPRQRLRMGAGFSGKSPRYFAGNTAFQSFFISTIIQPLASA